ncbi:response regulator receiver domain [Candidatus Poriferisodalis sp.]|uniref:response regulator receiver domain n=1 Tax=Candidatus Poriferisodalis sp. TaxID=3101277 RepID=UPI003B027580
MSAISDYFRTALLIDDRVAPDYGPLEVLDDEWAEGGEQEPTEGLIEPPAQDETPVHPAELVRAFLAAGVVCSVLEPAEGASDIVRQALRGAEIADLLILDWLLCGSDATTLEMIKAIASERTERLNVIVVFTGMTGLGDVAQRLVDGAQFETVDEYSLRRGNTVVLVFGKPGVRLTDGEDRRQPPGYGDLPGMICADLELVFKGLMPEFAFSGINALRESAPRILATFNAELDAGALIHRALLPEPSDAATQFVRLLASDFERVLHDGRVGDLWHIDSSSRALAQSTATGNLEPFAQRLRSSGSVQNALGELGQLSNEELAREAVSQGLCKLGMNDRAIRQAIPELTGALVDADDSNRKIAAMMDSVGLGDTPPQLELGVVLRRAAETQEPLTSGDDSPHGLWLCVQPPCDSVRLTTSRDFPLIPVQLGHESPDAMVSPSDGVPTGLSFVTQLHQLKQVRFSPNDAGAVVARGSAPNWYFTDVDDVRYDVMARLRPNLAARVAQTLGSAATRIGTDQSEWLRRGAPK